MPPGEARAADFRPSSPHGFNNHRDNKGTANLRQRPAHVGGGSFDYAAAVVAFVGAPPLTLQGRCGGCGAVHAWDNDVAAAVSGLDAVFAALDRDDDVDRALLLGSAGKMIGVLVVDDRAGLRQTWRAFSGDLGGREDQPGWVASVVRRDDTRALQDETWATVARVDAALAGAPDPTLVPALRAERRAASRRLMTAMTAATTLTNRAGVTLPLPRVFAAPSTAGIPSGTADCTLPKLLDAANRAGARPVGFAEAWWGPTTGVGPNRRTHATLQAPCAARCQPLIGWLLCDERPGSQHLSL